jgi:predicted kinase
MKNLYLTIGIPGSKKSTTCKEFAAKNPNVVLLTIDNFRKSFYDSQYNESEEDALKEFIEEVIWGFSESKEISIIIDESKWLINKAGREQWIDFGNWGKFDNIIALHFNKSIEFCLENNAQRADNKVPNNVIYELNNYLEKPDLSEGFTEILEW